MTMCSSAEEKQQMSVISVYVARTAVTSGSVTNDSNDLGQKETSAPLDQWPSIWGARSHIKGHA
jgi:hypothetical protein